MNAQVAVLLALLVALAPAPASTSIPATSSTPEVPAYIARPDTTAPAPGVVVLHGCGGYGKHEVTVADWLAQHGYVAVAINSFAPRGVHNACGDPSGSRYEAQYARATLEWMRAQSYIDGSRLALIGYSMGARATLDIADPNTPEPLPAGLRAAIVYYPPCRKSKGSAVLVPIRILDGDADDWTPYGPCKALAESAAANGKSVTITTYPGATHAFDSDRPDRIYFGHHLRYDPQAAADAYTQTLDFFRKHLSQ
jgi:dienelactone hydrolase